MKKLFRFEFEDLSAKGGNRKHDGIAYEHSRNEDEQFRIENVDGTPFLVANSSGLLMLAQIFAKMGLSEYKDGFHVHLREDFNGDSPDVLTVVVNNQNVHTP